MEYNYDKLKGRIREKFGTQGGFAKVIGIGQSTLNLKLNNNAEWTQEEMIAAMVALDEDESRISEYFFAHDV